jgi:hypothetical protein
MQPLTCTHAQTRNLGQSNQITPGQCVDLHWDQFDCGRATIRAQRSWYTRKLLQTFLLVSIAQRQSNFKRFTHFHCRPYSFRDISTRTSINSSGLRLDCPTKQRSSQAIHLIVRKIELHEYVIHCQWARETADVCHVYATLLTISSVANTALITNVGLDRRLPAYLTLEGVMPKPA